MDCSMPDFPVLHHLPEIAQTQVHWFDDAIQLAHPVIPFSSCLQSFPALGSFPVSQFFASAGQSIRASASALVSPPKDYSRFISFRIDWFDLLALQGTLKNLLQHHSLKASILQHSVFFMVQLSHPYMAIGKIIALTIQIFVSKVLSLLYNVLSRFVIAFLPRSKHLLISWQPPSTVILEPKKIKSVTVSTLSPCICHEVMRLAAMILVFWMLSFKPAFSLSTFTLIKRLFSSSSLSAIRMVLSMYLKYWYFSKQSWLQLVIHPAWHFTWCTLHIS